MLADKETIAKVKDEFDQRLILFSSKKRRFLNFLKFYDS